MANKEIKLKDGNDYLFPEALLNKIDTTDLLPSRFSTYTAIKDCVCYIWSMAYNPVVLDNVVLVADSNSINGPVMVPVKKGQTIKGSNWCSYAFGIKY